MTKQISLVDLKAQYLGLKKEIDKAIYQVIDSTGFIMGKEVEEFEEAFARYLGAKHVVAVNSGTAALYVALSACGIGRGDEIIVPTYTFTATAEAVVSCGAKPVFADIREDSYNIDVDKVESVIRSKTKAIIPVHLYGQPAEMEKILSLAKRYNLIVIEDAAQAHGAESRITNYESQVKDKIAKNTSGVARRDSPEVERLEKRWVKTGTLGDVGCFSFYPAKNLGAFGDGGAVVTNSGQLAKNAKMMRDHGRTEKYLHLEIGFNFRLDTIQAAVLKVKLKHLDAWNKRRRLAASKYSREIEKLVKTPQTLPQSRSVFHLYVVRAKKRNKLRKYLEEKGISTGVHYPIPLHLQPAYKALGYKKGDFPISEKAAEKVVSLPVYPEITDSQIEYICQCIKDFYS